MLKLDLDRLAVSSFEITSQETETGYYSSCLANCSWSCDGGNGTFQDQQHI